MGEPAIGYRFKMEIEGKELGVFTKVEGLGAKYDIVTVKEGGENGFVHKLPGRLEYDDLKLTRPVDDKSGALAAWFTGYQTALHQKKRLELTTASISAFDGNDFVVASWSLVGVFPIRYSGPSFQAGSSTVLTETLELSHQGFWAAGSGPGLSLSIGGVGLSVQAGASLGSGVGANASVDTGGAPVPGVAPAGAGLGLG